MRPRRRTYRAAAAAILIAAALWCWAIFQPDRVELPVGQRQSKTAFADVVSQARVPAPIIAPDFSDPALGEFVNAQGTHDFEQRLTEGLAAYRQEWASTPLTEISLGATLEPGAVGPRVNQLRTRLGFEPEGDFDDALSHRIRAFQQTHGLPLTGIADPTTINALNAGPAFYLRKIELNIRRAKALPVARGRSILVDTASARLWMYEGNRMIGDMPVIAGKAVMPTPVVFGLIRFAIFNPYWNVPPDLAQSRIAPAVLREGPQYLATRQFEILSDWSDQARPLSPEDVDWTAAAKGSVQLRVRQRPSPSNMMGAVKFMSPNPHGIYLHDTPDKQLFAQADRHQSSGCIRLPDAPRLARWLFQDEQISFTGEDARNDLPTPVPVFISYFTALPVKDGIRFVADVYGRDKLPN